MGAKSASGAFQAIVAQMPPHDLYIETHAGSGQVFFNKPPAPRSVLIERDPEAAKILRQRCFSRAAGGVEVVEGDALDWRPPGPETRVLLYADPPYVLSTRTSNRRYAFDYTDDDHRRLAAWLRSLPPHVSVILSGYPSPLYDELLGDWRTVEFQVMTRGGPRTEKLWLSFPAGLVAWATFAGSDRTDRQRIKRKAARWLAHYGRLSAGEKLALLAALLQTHSQDPA